MKYKPANSLLALPPQAQTRTLSVGFSPAVSRL
jgi:hypothetical protein